MTIKVTFVCLGNICRSPMAEGVFQDLIEREGLAHLFTVDSCGTSGYHNGETAHRGTLRTLKQHGISYNGRSRRLTGDDMETTDYLIAMDSSNLADIQRLGPVKGELNLLMDYVPGSMGESLPDPYYTGEFDLVYEMALRGSKALLRHIREKEGI